MVGLKMLRMHPTYNLSYEFYGNVFLNIVLLLLGYMRFSKARYAAAHLLYCLIPSLQKASAPAEWNCVSAGICYYPANADSMLLQACVGWRSAPPPPPPPPPSLQGKNTSSRACTHASPSWQGSPAGSQSLTSILRSLCALCTRAWSNICQTCRVYCWSCEPTAICSCAQSHACLESVWVTAAGENGGLVCSRPHHSAAADWICGEPIPGRAHLHPHGALQPQVL